MADPVSIQVALRIRPLVESEKNRGCQKCLGSVPDLNQVQITGTKTAFTYNFVFDELKTQADVYETAIKPMVYKLFQGYNVTILAYGQTGSGKTHSMGTCYDGTGEMGVIPRAIFEIFNTLDQQQDDNEFQITVSFMELYQENLYDLLSNRAREQCVVDIREDTKGIKIPGLCERPVLTIEETLKCLIQGSAGRATGATAMNATSSRSHAIFTVTVHKTKKTDSHSTTTAKFHLVDLAGSERSKKTKATGERFREGVNINRGLLALGNVISALGDEAQKGFISYRDSKLTRLLQDSLGGNSITLMIACVSPADYNLDETLSTLRYADRARKIKNKPVVNQDPRAAEISRLQEIIQQLRVGRLADGAGVCSISNQDVMKLREENAVLLVKNRQLNTALSSALTENTAMFERALITQSANEKLQRNLLQLKETYDVTLSNLNLSRDDKCPEALKTQFEQLEQMKGMIADLHVQQQKNEAEIQNHEYQSVSPHLDKVSGDHDQDLDERQEVHTKGQLDLNAELKELNRVLMMKEHLATQIIANANNMVDYSELTENELKIQALEKEKDELLQQLKNAHTSAATSKISEQRRKRVKDLETQLTDLNRKVAEQARMIKLKERDEIKIKQLNVEIKAMKANKVKLIKTMRTEEQRFRVWRQQREKDMMRLKEQDRKRQNQLVKMETIHHKQQTVLKRKVEEAVAINKRLKDALTVQKQAQERRGQNYGKTERIEHWVAQEVEVLVSTIDAERTLEQLLDDRALLNEQLSNLRRYPGIEDNTEQQETIQQLTEDIELRTAQIADLQQKIIDSDQENKAKTRWEVVQSMVEAKCALRKLFDLAADIRRKSANNEYKLDDLNTAHEEAIQKLATYENQLKEQSKEFKHTLSEVEKDYEEKIGVLLKQLRGISMLSADEALVERLKIQEEALEKMDDLRKEVEQYREECGTLREKFNQVNQLKNKPAKKTSNSSRSTSTSITYTNVMDSSLDDSIVEDDSNDPDWKKTPLYRRIAALRPSNISAVNKENATKRSSDGAIKCSCKGNCNTKVCGCRRMSSSCSDNCKCLGENCANRESTQLLPPRTRLFGGSTDDEDTKTRIPLEETFIKHKKKKIFSELD